MDFPFTIKINGKVIAECIALVEEDHLDPSEWTIYDVLVEGEMVPQRHWLREPIIKYLASPEMAGRIEWAWKDRLVSDLLEGIR